MRRPSGYVTVEGGHRVGTRTRVVASSRKLGAARGQELLHYDSGGASFSPSAALLMPTPPPPALKIASHLFIHWKG